MDPLLVAGRLRKKVDAILSDFNPFAGANLGANRRLEFAEVAEVAHVEPLHVHSVSGQIFISGTLAGMNRSASVTAITSATLTPGAVSCSVIFPPEKPITAISVTTRSTGREEVSGRTHFWTIFDFPFAACCIATMTRLAPLTRSIAPPIPGTILPGIIQFAR